MSICPSQQRRALVVDDDQATRLPAVGILKKLGVEATEARSGEHALQLFAEHPAQLVLLDVEMPGINGFETCQTLRSHPSGAHIPIVMMTSHDDVASVKRAFEVGATDFVMKPINWIILEQRIGYVLRAGDNARLLLEKSAGLDLAQQIASLGSFVWDTDAGTVSGSAEFRKLYSLSENASPVPIADLLDRVHERDRTQVEAALTRAAQCTTPISLDHRLSRDRTTERTYRLEVRPRSTLPGDLHLLDGISQDISRQRQAEEKIRRLAFHDSLTGVGNLASFHDKLKDSLERARRDSSIAGLMFLDLDRFKRINDTYGHRAGDLALQQVAHRLQRATRSSDFLARASEGKPLGDVSRMGGDEFTVILPTIRSAGDAQLIANRLITEIGRPIDIEAGKVQVGVSIGIAIFPDDGVDTDTLLRAADAAMYHAKDVSGDAFRYYDDSMNSDAAERMRIESRLRVAIPKGAIEIHYQPILSLRTGSIIGVEALARWFDDELGFVAPGRFIPVAEECGLIDLLSEQVLQKSCSALAHWDSLGVDPLTMSINLSPRQLVDRDLAPRIEKALAEHRLAPDRLQLEITESAIVRDEKAVKRTLASLHELGVHIALDDFGTGYSSLIHLKELPVDVIKIDRSFVSSATEDANSAALTRAVVAMGKALGLQTIAEGVETEAQRDFLVDCACDSEQGFRFSPAVPADQLLEFLGGF